MKQELETIELTQENIESMIYVIRNQKVMLYFDLARIYGYETKYLNRQVQRNIDKFPDDFRFQLTEKELISIQRCQNVTPALWATGKGGRSYLPYAFTESGIYMLMTVLKNEMVVDERII